ncbi:MAG: hypothetical protein JXA00_02775 [Candidatus Thermoplasmatota archaeon]|nr:hypothetical protein [Candidatus Thermoplasmatota archaeon]
MAETQVLPMDKKTWSKYSFYINVVVFFIIAIFIYLLIKDSISVGMSLNDPNAWFMVVRDIAFLSVGLVILFVQMYLNYRKLSRRAW